MRHIDHHRILQLGGRSGPKPAATGSWFRSGREALVALLRSEVFRLPDHKTVLLPAFCPEGIHAPFHAENWHIVFYDLTSDGAPDIDSLKRIVAETNPRVAVLIHLFGVPRDILAFRAILGDNVYLIEDFAHTWPGGHLPQDGAVSDARLFSLPKLAGLPDGGGLLHAAGISLKGRGASAMSALYIALRIGSLLCATLARRLGGERLRVWAAALNGRAYRILRSGFRQPTRISAIGRYLLNRLDQAALIERHVRQSEIYRNGIDHLPADMADADDPWPMIGFPVFTDNRPDFQAWLRKHGIDVLVFSEGWNFMPETAKAGFPGASKLSERHVLLPVSAKLTEEDILRVVRVVNAYPGSLSE